MTGPGIADGATIYAAIELILRQVKILWAIERACYLAEENVDVRLGAAEVPAACLTTEIGRAHV